MTKLTMSINKLTHDRHRNDSLKTDMMTGMMVTIHDIVMVIEKKGIEIMRTMVLIEKDIDLPVDMTLENQKGIQIALILK